VHDHQAKNNLNFSGESKTGLQKRKKRHKCSVEDIKAFTSQNIAGHNGMKTFVKPFMATSRKTYHKSLISIE
jgi:hypothetical protein